MFSEGEGKQSGFPLFLVIIVAIVLAVIAFIVFRGG